MARRARAALAVLVAAALVRCGEGVDGCYNSFLCCLSWLPVFSRDADCTVGVNLSPSEVADLFSETGRFRLRVNGVNVAYLRQENPKPGFDVRAAMLDDWYVGPGDYGIGAHFAVFSSEPALLIGLNAWTCPIQTGNAATHTGFPGSCSPPGMTLVSPVAASELNCVNPKAIELAVCSYVSTPPPTAQPTTRRPTTGPPSARPTSQPTSQPTSRPSTPPTPLPSLAPSRQPTAAPSQEPTTGRPSFSPSAAPSSRPSNQPTTSQPTSRPSKQPSKVPSFTPTAPSAAPTARPTSQPTGQPTTQPPSTGNPSTSSPSTASPTGPAPTPEPSGQPTVAPSTAAPASKRPTAGAPATAAPSSRPGASARPSAAPTAAPSTATPSTAAPSTAEPTSGAPTSAAPVTAAPSTLLGCSHVTLGSDWRIATMNGSDPTTGSWCPALEGLVVTVPVVSPEQQTPTQQAQTSGAARVVGAAELRAVATLASGAIVTAPCSVSPASLVCAFASGLVGGEALNVRVEPATSSSCAAVRGTASWSALALAAAPVEACIASRVTVSCGSNASSTWNVSFGGELQRRVRSATLTGRWPQCVASYASGEEAAALDAEFRDGFGGDGPRLVCVANVTLTGSPSRITIKQGSSVLFQGGLSDPCDDPVAAGGDEDGANGTIFSISAPPTKINTYLILSTALGALIVCGCGVSACYVGDRRRQLDSQLEPPLGARASTSSSSWPASPRAASTGAPHATGLGAAGMVLRPPPGLHPDPIHDADERVGLAVRMSSKLSSSLPRGASRHQLPASPRDVDAQLFKHGSHGQDEARWYGNVDHANARRPH
jgi:hypothetical protein